MEVFWYFFFESFPQELVPMYVKSEVNRKVCTKVILKFLIETINWKSVINVIFSKVKKKFIAQSK